MLSYTLVGLQLLLLKYKMASKAALPISENQMSKVNAENGQIQTNGSDAVLGSGEISKEINEINSQGKM